MKHKKGIWFKQPRPITVGVIIGLPLFLLAVYLIFSSPKTKPTSLKKIYTVRMTTLHDLLYFNGVVQPAQETPLVAPMEGVIEKMQALYGNRVQAGQTIFVLNSVELQKQYHDTLTEYLKSKDSYTIAQSKFIGTDDLWRAGLLSKNNYLSEKSTLNTAHIALMQSSEKLMDLLEKMGETEDSDLSQLSFSEFDKVKRALAGKHNLINLKAAQTGILLYPPRGTDAKNEVVQAGSSVKAGQVLGLIGDMSGIRLEIDIPEVDIGKVKPGIAARIHGIAFPETPLQGVLSSINAQAVAAGNGILPSFNAVVLVKNLTLAQQKLIKVGMSASVELAVSSEKRLVVPISAVKRQKGKTFVQRLQKNGKWEVTPVITGAATPNEVVILQGLKAGDRITYTTSNHE